MSYDSEPKKTAQRKNQGATFCRPEKKGKCMAQRTSAKYCPDCKMRVRGENHAEGSHHKNKS